MRKRTIQIALIIFLIFITILLVDIGKEALTGQQVKTVDSSETLDLNAMQPGTLVKGDQKILGEVAEDPIISALDKLHN